jgi:hypothetical protein
MGEAAEPNRPASSTHHGDRIMARSPKTPEIKPAAQAEVRQPTFDLNDPALQAIITQAVAVAMAAKAAEKANGKSDQSAKNEMRVISAFKKKGFGIVKPHEDVRTFNKWVAAGLRPKEGEHAVKVQNLRLFHKSQCRPLTKEEAAGFEAKAKEKAAKSSAKVVPISTGASL